MESLCMSSLRSVTRVVCMILLLNKFLIFVRFNFGFLKQLPTFIIYVFQDV